MPEGRRTISPLANDRFSATLLLLRLDFLQSGEMRLLSAFCKDGFITSLFKQEQIITAVRRNIIAAQDIARFSEEAVSIPSAITISGNTLRYSGLRLYLHDCSAASMS